MTSLLAIHLAWLMMPPGAHAGVTSEVRGELSRASAIATTSHLSAMLKFDRFRCATAVEITLELVHDYVFAAQASDPDVETRYQALVDHVAQPDRCLKAKQKALVLGSVYLSHPGNLRARDERRLPLQSIMARSSDGSWSKNIPRNTYWSYGLPLVFLTAELLNRDHIQFLTATERAARAARNPLWARKSEGATGCSYRITGAYACRSSLILIDPTLRPLDLAATLAHELDHLLRDKRYGRRVVETRAVGGKLRERRIVDETAEALSLNFARADGSIDWRRLVQLDETVAILTGALQQNMLRRVAERRVPRAFTVESDLRLTQRGGPIDAVVDATLALGNVSYYAEILSWFVFDLSKVSFLTNDFRPEVARASTRLIRDRVRASYFPALGAGPVEIDASDRLIDLRSERGEDADQSPAARHAMRFLALRRWISGEPASGLLYASWMSGDKPYATAKGSLVQLIAPLWLDSFGRELEVNLAELVDSLKKPSTLCTSVLDHASELEGYIGLQLGDPTRPGGEGVKGNDPFVHACLFDGVGA